jgi:hypothetical protein
MGSQEKLGRVDAVVKIGTPIAPERPPQWLTLALGTLPR